MSVVAGDLDGGSFVAQFHDDGRPSGVLAVNDPRQFLRHRRALQEELAR
jgi:3-phenylpropionate/trans-cinnamate dioxygenase ferredoxin reductase subunit